MDREFPQAGSEGELPPDFGEWERGVTCTVKPALLVPILPGREYRLNVTVRLVRPDPVASGFAELYKRTTAIASARARQLTCEESAVQAHHRIVAQAWFEHEIGTKYISSASLTLGISFLHDGEAPIEGEAPPAHDALNRPSGGNPEAFSAKHLDADGTRNLDELGVVFTSVDPGYDLTISYGEYVSADEPVDFTPILDRAQRCADFHAGVSLGFERATPTIVRREWARLATGKKDPSEIATVHLFARMRARTASPLMY
jgi:hypothetical protein